MCWPFGARWISDVENILPLGLTAKSVFVREIYRKFERMRNISRPAIEAIVRQLFKRLAEMRKALLTQ